MSLLQRVRDSGECSPSLLNEERIANDDGFATELLSLLYGNGLILSSEDNVAADFDQALKMAEDVLKIPGPLDVDKKRAVLEQRRCILLAIIACTPPTNPTIKAILSNGFLVVVKSWLDDILNGAIGGTDLLLHLLCSIVDLPVTKSQVVSSDMGKAIRDLEKHKICAGTPNESAIKTRVQKVKSAWNASVKVNKDTNMRKRPLESSSDLSSVKKSKNDVKKSSTFSTLLSKVSKKDETKNGASKPTSEKSGGADKSSDNSGAGVVPSNGKGSETKNAVSQNKSAKRVKWSDHFGGSLESSRAINDDSIESSDAPVVESNVSWSDRRKRDRLREKELLLKAKKSKIVDEDDEDDDPFNLGVSRMKPTVPWHAPNLLPERSNVTKGQCSSTEILAQASRKASVAPARYLSEEDVPRSPAPLTEVEEALDLAARAAAALATIPFFASQAAPAPPSVMAPAPAQTYIPVAPPPPMAVAPQSGATAEMVQAMGLPMFLAGSNVQALQTLAANPVLLNTFIDANGMYDQVRLTSLVQTLSQPAQPAYQQSATSNYGMMQQTSYQPTASTPASTYGTSPYGTATSASHYGSQPVPFGATFVSQPVTGYRGTSDAGNLHVSGYGPTTTQADLIAFFAPYVRVDEVVMKPNFSFVNTSDPDGATRVREALNGALLGGMPIRIKPAQRRNPSSAPPSISGSAAAAVPVPVPPAPLLPVTADGQVDISNIRDDRGNAPTKNLFVAGYGLGTTEQQLRDYFSQQCAVIGCVLKGTFSFVNTADRHQAVKARQALMGTMLNGGALRINFAKETGRLGTSFDTTYGPGTGAAQSRYGPAIFK